MRRIVRNLVGKLSDAFDYEIIPKWRLENWPLSTHLRDVFRHYEIGCVIDVGANLGGYGTFLRQEVGYDALIVSIEPVLQSFEALRQLAQADRDWLVYRTALGAMAGPLEINVTKSSQLCSFLLPDSSVVPKYSDSSAVLRTESVQVQRFDEFMRELRIERSLGNVYLKLDTQGWELEVLKGAGDALAQVHALQIEVSVLPIYQGITDYMSAIRVITEHGFDISGMFPVNRDDTLRVVDFDCVMVRRRS